MACTYLAPESETTRARATQRAPDLLVAGSHVLISHALFTGQRSTWSHAPTIVAEQMFFLHAGAAGHAAMLQHDVESPPHTPQLSWKGHSSAMDVVMTKLESTVCASRQKKSKLMRVDVPLSVSIPMAAATVSSFTSPQLVVCTPPVLSGGTKSESGKTPCKRAKSYARACVCDGAAPKSTTRMSLTKTHTSSSPQNLNVSPPLYVNWFETCIDCEIGH